MLNNVKQTAYGRSQVGLNMTKERLNQWSKRQERECENAFLEFRKILNDNWSGVDKDRFVKKLKEEIDLTKQALNLTSQQIMYHLNEDYKEFKKEQSGIKF